jgi:hypothetical protein
MDITITTYNEDGTVANVETSTAVIINTREELEALFASTSTVEAEPAFCTCGHRHDDHYTGGHCDLCSCEHSNAFPKGN